MGYTYFWERPLILPRTQFVAAAADCRRLCDSLEIPLGGRQGKGRPNFDADEICFNGHVDSNSLLSVRAKPDAAVGGWDIGPAIAAQGLGPDGDGSSETFWVQRVRSPGHAMERSQGDMWFSFCKTNHRPYDLCVQGCLIVLNHHFGTEKFRVASDGTSIAWNDARNACQHVLGFGIDWGDGKLAST